jgi:hypothetical protein
MDVTALENLQHALDLWVVEFSVRDNGATLIRSLEKVLQDNIANVYKNEPKDYLPVGLFITREDAERFRRQLIAIMSDASLIESRWQRLGDVLASGLSEIKAANSQKKQ